MAELRLLLIATLLYGTSVLANLPSADDTLQQDVTTINYNVNYMNTQTPDLQLHTRIPAKDVSTANQILGDLHKLDFALQGREQVAPHSLTTLTCSRALCFGDDGE
jgi:hypothetical protein